jgi:ATP-dependent helicase/nuclease subunit A
MTVHGAKGLEAPVVILPDTGPRQPQRPARLSRPGGDGPVFWPMSRAEAPPEPCRGAGSRPRRERAERNRLLYVALTRAESWLIVAAAGEVTDEGQTTGTWYGAVEAGLQDLGAGRFIPELRQGLRLQIGDFPGPGSHGTARPNPVPRADVRLPEWATEAVPPVPRDTGRAQPLGSWRRQGPARRSR